ncbi:ROK family protein [Paenibacillus aceti]|uniref:Glucokinase n=1 Tax=Paenibacillus aceti TaxID=1820010 RepID=A0ABQ1VV28_9BACL|nr:ROK family protein [Paenibacillus aceti]GGF97979.1 glucokinase [Paenibacillus aceti]
MKYAVGVDVGGTNIVCGLVDEDGNIVAQRKYPTDSQEGHQAILSKISATIEQLIEEAGIASEQCVAVGMGIPGLVDPEQGVSLRAVNLNWRNIPIAGRLKELTGRSVYIDNDVRMYVYGEAVAGGGRGHEFVYGVTIGTGLASAFVQHGSLHYGHRFMSGEIGHVPIENVDFPCNCGRIGCLETVVSATGIARQARSRITKGEASLLQEWFPDIADITASGVSRASDAGDILARDVLAQTGKTFARALAWVVPLLSPDAIVIGGGGALAGEALFAPMRQELDDLLLQDYLGQFVIKTAELNDHAGIVGSALWALKRSGSND